MVASYDHDGKFEIVIDRVPVILVFFFVKYHHLNRTPVRFCVILQLRNLTLRQTSSLFFHRKGIIPNGN